MRVSMRLPADRSGQSDRKIVCPDHGPCPNRPYRRGWVSRPSIATFQAARVTDLPPRAVCRSPSFDVVTVVTWESEAAMAAAREAVTAEAAARGFDRDAFMARLGVTGDFGTYVDA